MTLALEMLLPHIEGFCLHCRAGFENELQAEFDYRTRTTSLQGNFSALVPGLLLWSGSCTAPLAERNLQLLNFLDHCWPQWIFARQCSAVFATLQDIDTSDRISALLNALPPYLKVSQLLCETADTNDGKSLSRLARALESRLFQGLQVRDHWQKTSPWRLHLIFISGQHILLGLSRLHSASPWPGGVPRLKMPARAPSRSTLKLDEALQVFLPPEEHSRLLKPGSSVVDLGAAPGGWTWQMVQRGLLVTAVDHGLMQAELMQSGMVEHLKADGFIYRPRQRVDWMLCDMVEQPYRIAQLVALWVQFNLAKAIIANLKLPMKKRWDEVQLCQDIIRQALRKHRPDARFYARQLYHDREEITIAILPPSG